ncbi:class II aldolase/adducin family protein [Microbacterium suwonense]|uniref:L-ribulose-5-phosphate 4-epimerase n=1 Tax=Microbacterium suwonense TaxID=683047 RepID=A0ABM8FUX8_9MICO|nr:class II aldolase/adducin family protein [Microbacterium suwonense]BDZ39495.1 hypothetical protein GCM10025863_21090 [Microbacterium suwonense]
MIKPSGISYEDLAPGNMILCDLDGTAGSERSPSSDTAAHAYVHRHMPEVAASCTPIPTTRWPGPRVEEILCMITAMADEFGEPIPISRFAIVGDDSIGRGIGDTLRGHCSRAVLMQNHGPFTIGVKAKDAVKAAVMGEDVARTVHLAREAGPLIPIPQEAIDSLLRDRYQNVYGQSADARR